MRGVDVLIATPDGCSIIRTRQAAAHRRRALGHRRADRMLDMAFIRTSSASASSCRSHRQTLFFTATMPPEIQRITEQFLHNP